MLAGGRQPTHDGIDHAIGQRPPQAGYRGLGQLDVDLGHRQPQPGQGLRQHMKHGQRQRPHTQVGDVRGQCRSLCGQQLLACHTQAHQSRRPGGREAHTPLPTLPALHQSHPKSLLQHLQRLGDGRLCHVQAFGGHAKKIDVTMHRDGSSWRVHEVVRVDTNERDDVFAVRSRTSDTQDSIRFTEPVTMEVPTERLIRKMIERSLLDFNDAVRAKDFTDFFATVSNRWKTRNMTRKEIDQELGNAKNRITITMLNTAFKNFIDAGVDVSGITKGEMTLKEPARINSDGVLLVEGEFSAAPPTPLRTIFKMEYYFEGGRWKLFGISVDMKK